jgi:hypothetical protein
MAFRKGIYIVPTHRWYIERTVWLVAGFVLLTGTSLAYWVNPFFVLLVIATGIASASASSATSSRAWASRPCSAKKPASAATGTS